MNSNNDKKESKDKQEDIIRQEQKLQLHWHIFTMATTYFISWFFPGVLFFSYIFFMFKPYFLDTRNFINLFMDLRAFLSLALFPLIIILSYILHLIWAAIIVRFWWRYTQKKSPTKDGIIPRNIRSNTSKFYQIRSFLLKYPKNAVTKGIFPWLYRWMINFIGSAKIGKASVIEEEVCGDKFFEVGENCYVGPNSSLASHLVEGIFGNIYYFKVKLGDNVTLPCDNHLGPGSDFKDNTIIFPMGSSVKFTVTKGNNFYFGMPIRKIFTKKIKNFLQLSDEQLKIIKDLE